MTCDTLILLQNDGVCVDAIVKTNNPYINESDSLIGRNIFDVLPKATVAEFITDFESVVATGKQSNRNYDLPAKDKMYYFKCIMYKYDDRHVLCQYRDITQRSQMKKRLQTALMTLQEVERAARIGHWSFNSSLEVFNYTGFAGSVYRETELGDTLPLHDFLLHIHSQDKASILDTLHIPAQVGRFVEFRAVKDGKISYLRSKVINERLENGVRIIEGYTQNITDMLQRRQELEMVLSVVDNSTESIYANSIDGTLVFANRQCRLQNEIPLDADIKKFKSYQVLDNVHSKTVWDNFVQTLRDNNNSLHYVCNEPYPKFDIIASGCTSYIVKNGIGQDVIWSFRRDISSQIRYEEELKRAKELAEESDRLKTAFISNMSHEIRTPLNAIVGFSGIIAQTEDVAMRSEYFKIVQSNSNQLLRLVNEVLDLSRMEAGRVKFSIEATSLNDLGEELEAINHLLCGPVELHFDRPPSDFILHVDRGRLMQVASNLLANAIKFTQEGEIRFGYLVKGEKVEFYVSDTGIGIERAYLEKVFDRFAKINEFDQGSGLGLAICKTIVEKMGGEISVESVPEKGTVFRFTVSTTLKDKE